MTIETPQAQALTDTAFLGLLRITGVGAKLLLQGQLTCHLDQVTETQATLGAHCNPQGRILSLFLLFKLKDDYYMQMPRNMVPIALAALQKYAIFFKVALTDASTEIDKFKLSNTAKNFSTWKAEQIQAGIPAIYPETSGVFLPHEINLQYLHAIHFEKGCYTGQEIIARMHYRGQLKKHMYRGRVKAGALPPPGSDIYSEKPCGLIVDSYQEDKDTYQLLFVTEKNLIGSQPLYVSPTETHEIEILPLPYIL